MNIVIVGDGKVGHSLADQLCCEEHEVTVIDNNSSILQETSDMLDVHVICGNGASMNIQIEAGVPYCDLLIAATSSDEVNMVSCLIAKKLGAKSTIARIRNPDYKDQMKVLEDEFNLSLSINPELATAMEISRLIRIPAALRIDTFVRGRVDLIEFKIKDDNKLIGKKLKNIFKNSDEKVLICAVDRNDEVVIPNGEFELELNDKIHITGDAKQIQKFLRSIGKFEEKIKSAIILGGGKISFYLAKMLTNMGVKVKITEINPEKCRYLSEKIPEVEIINDDGTEQEVLESLNISSTGAFIALTNIDEENMVTAMYAHEQNVKKVITKINRRNYAKILNKMGLDSVVSPKEITVDQIVRYVRAMQNTVGSKVLSLTRIVNGKAEALEFKADAHTKYLNITLDKVPLKNGLLIAIIVHGNRVIVPGGKDVIKIGDSIIVVTKIPYLDDINDIFDI